MADIKNEGTDVKIDASALLDPTIEPEAVQVEDTTVIFVPHKDFEARVNQDVFPFRAGVPTRIPRDLVEMLTSDKTRGYVRD